MAELFGDFFGGLSESLGTSGNNAYKPVNLQAAQIAVESGGKQTDKNGKVLVGKYKDGSMPAPNQRAFGVSQIQVGTARETAQKHGIPWDESKLMSDRDYNLQLGDLHKGDLLTYYKGDQTLATAAYHSGRRNVDKAVAAHGREGFTKGLGPHGRDYVRKLHGEGGGAVAGKDQFGLPDIKGSRFGSQSKAALTTGGQTKDAFSQAGDIKGRAQKADDAAGFLGQLLGDITTQVTGEQEKQIAIQTKKNADQQVLLDAQRAQTQEMMNKTAPIFAQQSAIAERRVELSKMNFFEKTFAGLFNQYYDPDYLDGRDKALQQQVVQAQTQFQVETNYRESLGKVLNQEYTNANELSTLVVKNLMNNFNLAATSVQVANQQLQTGMAKIDTDIQLLESQHKLKSETLNQLTNNEQINTLLAQADQNGGTVVVNGTPLTSSELVLQGRANDQQDKQYQLLQLSLAQGSQALIEAQMETYISKMTPSQRMAAAQNNYVDARGVQLNPKVLGAYLNTDTQITSTATEGALTQMGGEGAIGNVKGYLQLLGAENRRAGAIFGSQQSALTQTTLAQSQELMALVDKMKAAPEGPHKDQLRNQVNATVAKMNQQKSAVIESQVKGFTRDGDAQQLVRAWVGGQRVTPEQAIKGFIGLAKGGSVIPGVDPRSPIAGPIANAQRAVNEVYDRYGGVDRAQSILGGKDKTTAGQLQLELQREVNRAMRGGWLNLAGNDVVTTSPQWAKADGHPAGRINPQDIVIAQRAGNSEGLKMLTSELGITESEAASIFGRDGTGGGGLSAPKAKQLGWDEGKFQGYKNKLATYQTQAMMRQLDVGPSATTTFRPSRALADFMRSDGFQGRVRNLEVGINNHSFGNMLVSSVIGDSALAGSMAGYAQKFSETAADNDRVDIETFGNAVLQAKRDPQKRAQALIASIPDLDPAGEQLILSQLKPILNDLAAQDAAWDAGVNGSGFGLGQLAVDLTRWQRDGQDINDPIVAAIMHGEFKDKRAETLRKKIAPKIQAASQALDKMLRGLSTNAGNE